MTIYIQLDSGNVIRDAITYPYGDYIEAEYPESILPVGINGGWWRYTDGKFTFDQALYDETNRGQGVPGLEELEKQVTELTEVLAALLNI